MVVMVMMVMMVVVVDGFYEWLVERPRLGLLP